MDIDTAQSFARRSEGRTLTQVIEGHANNFTWARLVLAASVIYYHSFVLARPGYRDHITAWLFPVTSVGALAVIMFFFLSGLFVTQSLHRNQNVPGFIVKRALRIWPGYFVCLAVTALLASLVGGDFPFSQYLRFSGLYDYVARNSIFDINWYITGVFSQNGAPGAINGSIHTLPMESKMYVVLAVLGLLRLTSRPALIIAGAALALCIGIAIPAEYTTWFFVGDYSRRAAAMFIVGMIVYGVARRLRIELWQGVALAVLAYVSTGIAHTAFFLLTAAWVVTYLGQVRLPIPALKSDLSYGVYLYGWPATQIVTTAFHRDINPYLLSLLSLALAAAFAWASWKIVEHPAIALGKAIGRRKIDRRGAVVMAVLLAVLAGCFAMRWVTLRHDLAPVAPLNAQVIDFGPHAAKAGDALTMWVKTSESLSEGVALVVDGRRLPVSVGDHVISAAIPRGLLSKPGTRSIYLEMRTPAVNERSTSFTLDVSQ